VTSITPVAHFRGQPAQSALWTPPRPATPGTARPAPPARASASATRPRRRIVLVNIIEQVNVAARRVNVGDQPLDGAWVNR